MKKDLRIDVGDVHLVGGESSDLAALLLLSQERRVVLDNVPDEFGRHLRKDEDPCSVFSRGWMEIQQEHKHTATNR